MAGLPTFTFKWGKNHLAMTHINLEMIKKIEAEEDEEYFGWKVFLVSAFSFSFSSPDRCASAWKTNFFTFITHIDRCSPGNEVARIYVLIHCDWHFSSLENYFEEETVWSGGSDLTPSGGMVVWKLNKDSGEVVREIRAKS